MEIRRVTFKEIKSKEFHNFMDQLQAEVQEKLTIKRDSLSASDAAEKLILWKIKSLFSSLTYFAAVDTVQNSLHGVLKGANHLLQSSMIQELNIYNIERFGESKFDIITRMKIDIIMLLLVEGKTYCRLALNECDALDDNPFHVETYKHIGRGIWHGLKSKSIGKGIFIACVEREKEEIRIRANALRDINMLILLYLYSCYLSQDNIGYVGVIMVWLIENGYKWFDIKEQPDRDLLGDYFEFQLPDIISGVEGKKIINIYEDMASYQNILLGIYPDTPNVIKKRIEAACTYTLSE